MPGVRGAEVFLGPGVLGVPGTEAEGLEPGDGGAGVSAEPLGRGGLENTSLENIRRGADVLGRIRGVLLSMTD